MYLVVFQWGTTFNCVEQVREQDVLFLEHRLFAKSKWMS